jgi:hypothetical protein
MLSVAACDWNGYWLTLVTGLPGSYHDARGLRYLDFMENDRYRQIFADDVWCMQCIRLILSFSFSDISIPIQSYLLADSAFPCYKWLIPPVKSDNLTPHEVRFNRKHAGLRNCVERGFGLLKQRWRQLFTGLLTPYPDRAARTIHTCFILQNFCLKNKDPWRQYEDPLDEEDEVFVEDFDGEDEIVGYATRANIILHVNTCLN